MKILKPAKAHRAYDHAAEIFQSMHQKITGVCLPIVTEDDGDDLIVLGSDAVNSLSAKLYLDGLCFFRCVPGTDSYHIQNLQHEGRKLLIFAAGRGRAILYAVYRYFEKYCGCHYYWDGDVIPTAKAVLTDNIDLSETPRFQYRGIRYFAHRSLHRFQAEHWSLEDWQHEIHWMLKKRLNLFMLRIGNDDLFQRAFPDIVGYPSETENASAEMAGGETEGYNDRTSAWSLKYRGQLRRQVLDYAFSCDLMHPEDCGTMTHWYTRTPVPFLEKVQPKLLQQSSADYKEKTGLVWDITDDQNFENYYRLTQTHLEEFGRPELFHTIGLAERSYSKDRETNMRLKSYVYHRMAQRLAEDYPTAPLLIASWDLMLNYTPEEVGRLLEGFDPKHTILLDYTSDSVRRSCFENWSTVGKFPWMFGIFHGYESDTDIRGFYPMIEKKLEIAKNDPMCCGFVIWPELSHSDTFMLEFFAENSWQPLEMSMGERIDRYCHGRYGADAQAMCRVWEDFFPLLTLCSWNVEQRGLGHKDAITDILFYLKFEPHSPFTQDYLTKCREYGAGAAEILNRLQAYTGTDNEMLRRDLVDIARTVLKRYIQYAHWKIEQKYMNGEETETLCAYAVQLTKLLTELLEQYEEFSLYHSFEKLKAVQEVNPAFEETLLKNASNQYCRTHIYELFRYQFLPEQAMCFEMLHRAEKEGVHPNAFRKAYAEKAKQETAEFNRQKLENLKPHIVQNKAEYVSALLAEAASVIGKTVQA